MVVGDVEDDITVDDNDRAEVVVIVYDVETGGDEEIAITACVGCVTSGSNVAEFCDAGGGV